MAGAKVPLTFRIFKGDQLLREERLSLSVIKLGKVPSAHLKLEDETVSRMHAIIEVNGPGDVSIIDLGSTKGTFVNGQKVNKAKLQSGDTIVVGETKIELAIGSSEEEDVTKVNTASVPPADVIASTPRPAPSGPSPSGPSAAFTPPAAPLGAPSPLAQTMPAAAPPPVAARPAAPPAAVAAPTAPGFGTGPSPAFSPPPMMSAPAPITSAPAVRPPPGMPGAAPVYGTAMAPPINFQQSMAESVDEVGGTRAVEVAAMLGDSVVGVKHCMDPRGGKVTSLTYAMFGIGLATMIAASVAFYLSVDNAAYNQGKFEYETQVKHRPPGAVKKRKLSLGYDWVAFGGLLVSLGSFTYGLARLRTERKSPFFRIGTAPGVEFATENAPNPSFPLVAPHGDDFAFNFAHGMEGEMIVGGQSTSLSELAAQGRTSISPIPANAKIRVRAGKTTFLISAVPQPRRAAAPLFASLESRVLAYFGGSLAAHLIFWFIIDNVPPEAGGVQNEGQDSADTTARSATTAKEDPTQEEPEDKPEDGDDTSGGTGTAMTLEEGKMGIKTSTRAEGQYKMQNNNVDPQLARQQAVDNARTAGILGAFKDQQIGGAFASLTATGDISSGFDDSNVYGGLLGNEPGEMNGGFGYGRSGFGPGGGGTGWGTIGTGRYGTIGHGSGTGSGYGVGSGRGGMKGRQAAVPSVAIGSASSAGDLDKAIIRRYIRQNLSKISYCYEKELIARPTLNGTVSTEFLISGNGTVTASSANGVDPAVSTCVAAVIGGIKFPQPKNGGNVQVNYPFIFRPAGS